MQEECLFKLNISVFLKLHKIQLRSWQPHLSWGRESQGKSTRPEKWLLTPGAQRDSKTDGSDQFLKRMTLPGIENDTNFVPKNHMDVFLDLLP